MQDCSGAHVREDWESLRQAFASEVQESFSSLIDPGQPHYPHQFAFALGRLEEGLNLVRYFDFAGTSLKGERLDALDLGCGNGGVAVAFANCRRYRVYALDLFLNSVLFRLVRDRALPVRHTLGSGHELPFRDASFDLILLVDVIEHVRSPRRLGSEIMRVLRPGGVCFVSTAARLRYLWRLDPHYGIRGLVAWPNGLQRFLVNRVWRRKIRDVAGRAVPAYDVERTFLERG